jgi:hypothetical protein
METLKEVAMKKTLIIFVSSVLLVFAFVASADLVSPTPNDGKIVDGVWVPN